MGVMRVLRNNATAESWGGGGVAVGAAAVVVVVVAVAVGAAAVGVAATLAILGFPKIKGNLVGEGPYSKDHSILGSIFGPLILGNRHGTNRILMTWCDHHYLSAAEAQATQRAEAQAAQEALLAQATMPRVTLHCSPELLGSGESGLKRYAYNVLKQPASH